MHVLQELRDKVLYLFICSFFFIRLFVLGENRMYLLSVFCDDEEIRICDRTTFGEGEFPFFSD